MTKQPTCFNSYPGPQHRSENDCDRCKLDNVCSPRILPPTMHYTRPALDAEIEKLLK